MTDRTLDQWLTILEAAGVPCGPINTIDRLFSDPQIIERGTQIDVDGMPLVANPIKYSRSEMDYQIKPPKLGVDTDVVLQTALVLDQATIDQLRGKGIVG